jgi:hypothetical protein
LTAGSSSGWEGGTPMTTWTRDELDKIGNAEELEIASLQGDGTPRKGATIWVVRHGDDRAAASAGAALSR